MVGGHTNTERGYLPVLAEKLLQEIQSEGRNIEGLEILVSKRDAHPLTFV